jgi:hypothetical protein
MVGAAVSPFYKGLGLMISSPSAARNFSDFDTKENPHAETS